MKLPSTALLDPVSEMPAVLFMPMMLAAAPPIVLPSLAQTTPVWLSRLSPAASVPIRLASRTCCRRPREPPIDTPATPLKPIVFPASAPPIWLLAPLISTPTRLPRLAAPASVPMKLPSTALPRSRQRNARGAVHADDVGGRTADRVAPARADHPGVVVQVVPRRVGADQVGQQNVSGAEGPPIDTPATPLKPIVFPAPHFRSGCSPR